MDEKYEKYEMTVILFDRDDMISCTAYGLSTSVNGIKLYKFYGGIDGGNLNVDSDS